MSLSQDAEYMARALKLAEKGCYTTDPNPRVGCVLVKDRRIIAEGWHKKAGLAHAEVNALAETQDAKGATAYVTLEPCSHTGKTGPCCDALIDAGIKRVVVAMRDPNPLVAGTGLSRMREAGIAVDCGALQQEALALNKGFVKRMSSGLPWVRSKLAMSLDGRTAMASGESKWITSAESRLEVQQIRAGSAAILTGINTVLADDPAMNVRLEQSLVQPVRVVLDSALKMPLDAKMIPLTGQTWILTCSDDKQKKIALEALGCQVFQVNSDNNKLDLSAVMLLLGQQQINTVLVEAGATLNGALLEQNLVDEWVVFMAPCVLGDKGRGLFHLPTLQTMADKKQFSISTIRHIGSDLKLTLKTQ